MKGDIKMKKILFAIAIVLTMALSANAQRDGFFGNFNDNTYGNRAEGDPTWSSDPFDLPTGNYEGNQDQPLPLGTGLLILTALGAGYAVARKKK